MRAQWVWYLSLTVFVFTVNLKMTMFILFSILSTHIIYQSAVHVKNVSKNPPFVIVLYMLLLLNVFIYIKDELC